MPVVGDTDERFCGAYKLYHSDGTHMAHCDTPVALALKTGLAVHDLLHPPLLDELGLPSVLRSYIEGFAERSNIAASIELPADLPRLPREHELCLFRIAQEMPDEYPSALREFDRAGEAVAHA